MRSPLYVAQTGEQARIFEHEYYYFSLHRNIICARNTEIELESIKWPNFATNASLKTHVGASPSAWRPNSIIRATKWRLLASFVRAIRSAVDSSKVSAQSRRRQRSFGSQHTGVRGAASGCAVRELAYAPVARCDPRVGVDRLLRYLCAPKYSLSF